jgi:hypothetical protein
MTTTLSFLSLPLTDMVVMSGCCFALVLATTGMHYEALRALNLGLARRVTASRARVAMVVLSLFIVHVAEVFVYAAVIFLLARHAGMGTLGPSGPPPFDVTLYFSLETYSSLGYGDVVPSGALRMMAGAEALNGLVLIGWSASYVHIAMERFWQPDDPGA